MIVLTVCLFSLIQSLFGMGLLIFGTPTLLLFGVDFFDALATLLPASITISFLQFAEDRSIEPRFARQFVLWCLPSLGLGLATLLHYGPDVPLEMALGGMMFLFGLLRLLPSLSTWITGVVRRNLTACMVLMGAVHGLSNLGGSVLSMIASAHSSDKRVIRRTVAFCYLALAMSQIAILLLFRPEVFTWTSLITMAFAAIVYLSLGRRTFKFIHVLVYERMFLLFMFAYALVLFGRGAGLV